MIDTYSKNVFTKLYDRKNALVTADILNDRVVPFYEKYEIPVLRILTDRGTEYCGKREHHEYQLYLAIEDIDHTKTKAKSPQTNGICERFHRTVQDEFYAIAFRKKIYSSIEELQIDLDAWIAFYNEKRTHSGKHCYGKTPYETFVKSIPLAKEKMLSSNELPVDFFSTSNPSKTGQGFEVEEKSVQKQFGQIEKKPYLQDKTSSHFTER